MFFVLFSLITSKAIKAAPRNFNNIIKKNPFSIVLFTNSHCLPCRQIQNIMDTLSVKYRDAVNMVYVDAAESVNIVAKYGVSVTPTILVFKRDTMIMKYLGEWNNHDITNLCEMLCNEDIIYLNNSFDVFHFQKRSLPANLILSRKFINKADKLFNKMGGAFHIGVVENNKLADELNLSNALFNRPAEGFSQVIDDLDKEDLIKLSNSDFVHIKNQNFAGTTNAPNTLFVLLDENDPYQINHAMERMKMAKEHFGKNLGYQYCDFFTCSNYVQQLGVFSFENPVYLLNMRDVLGSKFEVFKNPLNIPKDVLDWLKFHIEGIELPKDKDSFEIPKLHASQFIQKVLDPKLDVILLVGTPQMQLYKESRKNFHMLIELFKDYKTIQFYEFNPSTEHIPGLDFPVSGAPQISVWPAKDQRSGSLFQAYISMDVIIQNLLRLIVTKISNEDMTSLNERLQNLQNEYQ